ncbi:hypothetical protein QZH41_014099, partial [Actinostola sp. cb2023]
WKIHYFVALGLDLCKRDSRGQTVLHIAAECGYIDVVEYCLRKKRFDPGITENSLMTPLHFAVQNRKRQCAWIIESSSVKSLVYLVDIHGKTPIDYADQSKTAEQLYSDPGVVTTSRLKEDGQPYTILDIASGHIAAEDFCTDCELVIPPISKHCRLCGHCVLAIDHHCLFLMCCVAVNNHRHFVLFMTEVLIAQLLFIRASSTYILGLIPSNGKFPSSFKEAMGQEVYISTLLLLNCLGFLWVLLLAVYQCKVVSEGGTTFYTPEGSQKVQMNFREMFSFGRTPLLLRARNLFLFFVGGFSFYKNQKWEQSV